MSSSWEKGRGNRCKWYNCEEVLAAQETEFSIAYGGSTSEGAAGNKVGEIGGRRLEGSCMKLNGLGQIL